MLFAHWIFQFLSILIENTFPSLGNNASSYFAYKKMEMFVHGGDPESNQTCDWCEKDTSIVDLLFRIGKDDNNYYEIHQPVYEGWNDKNHIDINIYFIYKYIITE